MVDLKRKIGLNSAQREIVRSEDVFPGSALNTISVGMFFENFQADKVALACNKVFESADVFSAALVKEGQDYFFCPQTSQVQTCRIGTCRTRTEADAYLSKVNAEPMGFPGELYLAEAFDLAEGGSCLIVRFHHILVDGFGMSLFAQRIADAVEGREFSSSVFFRQLPCDEAAGRFDDDNTFWRTCFSDYDAESTVFSEKAMGFAKTPFPVSISKEVQSIAQEIAKRSGVSLPYVYAAAYAIYLRGATGKKDAVFLMARRNRTGAESDVIGCYTLVVPVRVHISAEDRFDDVCRKLSASAKAASAHKSIGYSAILKILKEEHGIAEAPSMYGFNWYSRSLQSTTPIMLRISTAGEMQGHLTWNVFTEREGLTSSFDLRNGIYDADRAKYLSESLCGILRMGVNDPAVRQIPVVAAEERKRLSQVRGVTYETDGEATIPSLFRDAVRRYGKAAALYSGEHVLSFSELDELSDRIAKNLILCGVCRGDKVAFMLERDVTLIPTLLGISKSGAAFIPVDPAYPKDRIEHILSDSHAKYLISATGEEWADGGIRVSSLFEDCEQDVSLPKILQSDLAYMIYTSGTTGKPKGVMLSHRGIVNITHPENNPFNRDVVKNGHGIVAIGSICFDISLFEIFVPLFNGKFVVFGNELAMRDASALADCITAHGADILHCTPSRIAAYLKNSDFQAAIGNVRMILSAGEVLPGSLVLTLKEKYGIRIYNGYGPTETTIGATISEAGDHESIGAPIGNTGILLLNAEDKQVPYGAVGEICVYGNGVGLGYYGRDEETQKKFVDFEGMRVYKTGDLGHLTADGRLMYHGRCDRQIKLRGLRIELSEIEAVMLAYPGIGQAACLVKKTKRSEHLVGFYTHSDGTDAGEALKAHMKRHLTEYMVPDLLVRLPEMPQTPGGKLDMRALGQMEVEFEKHYVAPHNREEKAICEAFAEVTGEAEPIGTEDNFFEFGMDSLSASLFLLKIEEKLQERSIEYGDIYAYPTAQLLAVKIRDGGQKRGYPIEKQDYSGFEYLVNRDITSPVTELPMGNILLTGATGYLGIHILLELLNHPERFDKIICLARPKGRMSAAKRIRSALFYYGEADFSHMYGDKWEVVEGDVTDPSLADTIREPVQTVLHTAANVAHFAHDDSIEKANVGGVQNMIEFALRKNACLCHVSTISVAGVVKRGVELPPFTEKDLYVGQEIHNQYIWSKYMAEYEIMRAAIDRGLCFKIMRVGNLQGRISDGEFQMNMKTNNFTRCLSSYVKMGIVPQSVYDHSVNFSPVDEVARMIIALSSADRSNAVYHVSPEKETAFAALFAALREHGHDVSVVQDADFEQLLREYKRDPDKQETVEALLAEKPDSDWCDLPLTQDDTSCVLRQLGKQWKPITEKYLNTYIGALDQLNMFE